MSHISSTIKRYTDTDYSKSYVGYGSYASNHSSSFSDRNKLSYKSTLNSSYYSGAPLRSYGDLDRSLPPLDLPIKRTDILARSPSKYTQNAYSFGYNSSYSTFQPSPISSLSRKKSSSHTDLSLGFSELRTSDAYCPRSPGLTRSRHDLDSTSRTTRASNHTEYGDVYGKKRGSTNGFGLSCAAAPEPVTSLAKSTSRFLIRDTSYSYEKNEGSSGKEAPPAKVVQGLVGLRNLGNTCFMNSILQCLSNTKELRDYCLHNSHKRDLNSKTGSTAIMEEFARLLQAIWTSSVNEVVSPSEFKTQIQRYAPRFMGYNQQDAQEFLRFLLDGLHNEVNRINVRPRPCAQELDHLPDSEKGKQMWKRYLEREDSRIVELFVGQLKSSLTCTECGYCSTVFDPFWDLSLPIAKKSIPEVSLMDCIRLFTKEDVLDGDEKPTCCRCKARRRCTKKFTIQKFPKILVLHLKRFSEGRIRSSKLSTFVNFPLKDLDLREFSSEPSTHTTYNLYAVSNHSGTTMGGHYTAYCKNPNNGEWYTFNDSRVTAMSSSQVRSSDAYVLFYELSGPSSRM